MLGLTLMLAVGIVSAYVTGRWFRLVSELRQPKVSGFLSDAAGRIQPDGFGGVLVAGYIAATNNDVESNLDTRPFFINPFNIQRGIGVIAQKRDLPIKPTFFSTQDDSIGLRDCAGGYCLVTHQNVLATKVIAEPWMLPAMRFLWWMKNTSGQIKFDNIESRVDIWRYSCPPAVIPQRELGCYWITWPDRCGRKIQKLNGFSNQMWLLNIQRDFGKFGAFFSGTSAVFCSSCGIGSSLFHFIGDADQLAVKFRNKNRRDAGNDGENCDDYVRYIVVGVVLVSASIIIWWCAVPSIGIVDWRWTLLALALAESGALIWLLGWPWTWF